MATQKKRSRLSRLEIVIMVGLAVAALGPLATMVLDGKLIPTGLIFVVIPLVLAGLVFIRNRWLMMLIVAINVFFLIEGFLSPIVQQRLAFSFGISYFVLELARLVVFAIVIVTGLVYLVRPSR